MISPLSPESRLNSAESGVGLSAALLTVAEMGKDPWGVGEMGRDYLLDNSS
jgi:hypothetical protein